MTIPRRMPRSDDRAAKLIRTVQACRRKVQGLDDETAWRGFLELTTSINSLRRMSLPQLARVIEALHEAGAPRTAGKGAGTRKLADDAQSKMMRGLWIELHAVGAVHDSSEVALAVFAKRQTGVEMLHWLDARQANKVIEGLKKWLKRAQAEKAADDEADASKSDADMRAECEALWQRLKDFGAIELKEAPLERYGYKYTGKGGWAVYERADYVKLRAALRRWVAAVTVRRGRR